jgi:hypothetical protein
LLFFSAKLLPIAAFAQRPGPTLLLRP